MCHINKVRGQISPFNCADIAFAAGIDPELLACVCPRTSFQPSHNGCILAEAERRTSFRYAENLVGGAQHDVRARKS
jgi:hypothetical protein